jgi:hypothetical protein
LVAVAEALEFWAWDEAEIASAMERAGANVSAGRLTATSLDGGTGNLGRWAVPGYVGGHVREDGSGSSAYFNWRNFVIPGERKLSVLVFFGALVAETAANATLGIVS